MNVRRVKLHAAVVFRTKSLENKTRGKWLLTGKSLAEAAWEFAQGAISRAPVIILGSGASAAHGVPGMVALSTHLTTITLPSDWTTKELGDWTAFRDELTAGSDLESALGAVRLSDRQTDFVAASTRHFLLPSDHEVLHSLFSDRRALPLTRLFRYLFRSAQQTLNVVTPNYDRLAEYAADAGEFSHFTGFHPGLFQSRVRDIAGYVRQRSTDRTVCVWKVHGSLDWFIDGAQQIIASPAMVAPPTNHVPLMVTPGFDKYRRTHIEPYRTILSCADRALEEARAYLCVGYGFNDEHLQQKLVERCDRDSVPLVVITMELSAPAKAFLTGGRCRRYLALERSATGTRAYTNDTPTGFDLPGEDTWQLARFLDMVIGADA